ncbi:MAG: rhamnan synthesis F family protein [Pseudomonadota bacterium]|nr:rhamnan synthesis F family protein [Pseudomonadota bacterium]
MRRICLFSGYDKENKIQDYVVYLIKELSKVSEVYFMGNCRFPPDELFKIAPYTQMFYAKQLPLKDFGAWQYMIAKLGWEKLVQYDELILCNDSVYGPLYDLENFFRLMERRGYDFWSVTSDYEQNFHLHSYCMAFSQDVIKNAQFRKFWQTVPFFHDTQSCELELTPLLTQQGFIGNSYIRTFKQGNVLHDPVQMIQEHQVPFIKVKSFLPENDYTAGTGIELRYQLRTKTDYDTSLIPKHINMAHLPQTVGQRIARFAGL